MYLFNNTLKSAFKRRPPGIIPGQGIESAPGSGKPKNPPQLNDVAPSPIDLGVPDNQGEIDGHPYKFNIATGIPPQVSKGSISLAQASAGKPLLFAEHAKERALQKGLDFDSDLGHLRNSFPQPEHGFKPVEVEVSKKPEGGSRISKLVMRGPRKDKSDAVMPVIFERDRDNTSRLVVPTVWPNDRDDNHSNLDLHRVHLREEFKMGQSPTRPLKQLHETKQPGYRPLMDSPEVRAEILRKHGRIST